MFSHTLLHSLTEIPVLPNGITIQMLIPGDPQTLEPTGSGTSLLHLLSSGHIVQPGKIKLSFNPLPAWAVLYVTKGQGAIVSDEKKYSMKQSSLLVFDCGTPFSINALSGFQYDIIYFKGEQAAYLYSQIAKDGCFYLPSVSATGLNSWLRPILPTAVIGTPLSFHRHLTDFFAEAAEYIKTPDAPEGPKIPEYILMAKDYISDNFYRDIDLADLESRFFTNRYRICRDFSKYCFTTPIQFLHQVRITKAKQLLADTSLKVHEIGYQVGYESTTRFIEQFKKFTGNTPEVYRKKL